jgi:hypothetical protein
MQQAPLSDLAASRSFGDQDRAGYPYMSTIFGSSTRNKVKTSPSTV